MAQRKRIESVCRRLVGLIACGLALSSCSSDLGGVDEFVASADQLPDGRWIADGDILFPTIDAMRQYYFEMSGAPDPELAGEGVASRSNALTLRTLNGADRIWAFPQRMHLTYCVDTASFGSRATELLTALDVATESWSRRVGVFFERVDASPCDKNNNTVVFNVRSKNLPGPLAAAFPPYYVRQDRELLVDDGAFSTSSSLPGIAGILRHELGHVLGFRHENIWILPACTLETPTISDGSYGTAGARQLTPYDEDSVMHLPECRTTTSNEQRQTDFDYQGAIGLYGLAPALTVSAVL